VNPEFAWLRNEKRISPEDLRIGAQHAKDLLQHPGWEFVVRMIGHSQQRTVNDMVLNGPHEQAKYAELAGFVRGLKAALDAPSAAVLIADGERERRQRDAETAEQRREQ
jgi:hypothetical protein